MQSTRCCVGPTPIASTGLVPVGNSPDEFGPYILTEIEKWGKVVKALNLQVD